MTDGLIETLGRARLEDRPLPDAPGLLPSESDEIGYEIQARLAAWFSDHGQGAIAGYKIGATARGMQALLGVSGPVYGHVMSRNVSDSGVAFAVNPGCKPGVECEIAFRLGADLPSVQAPFDRDAVAAAMDAVLPCLEIVENRYGDYRACSLALLAADDFFHKACVIGAAVTSWRDRDLLTCAGRVFLNGEQVESGIGSEVLGDPLSAVVWLANKLADRGTGLKAGQIVSTGSMTPVHWVTEFPASIDMEIEGLGNCSVLMDSAPTRS